MKRRITRQPMAQALPCSDDASPAFSSKPVRIITAKTFRSDEAFHG
jgi:hypothetical protein